MNYDVISAILALDPNAQVSVNGDGVDEITWHDENPNNSNCTCSFKRYPS